MFFNRAIVITSLAGGAIALLLSFLYGNALIGLLSALLFMLSIALWKYGYLIIPVFTKAAKVVEVRDGYEVPSARDCIVKKNPNGYYASKFMEIKYYESSLDKRDEEKRLMFEVFEKALSSLKYIVKISLLVSAIDISSHVDELKTRRSTAEAKRAKLGRGQENDAARLDREIAMYSRQLDRITSGERPIEVIAYCSTTAFGLTKEEAVAKARRQAKEVSTILSGSLSADVTELSDLDMLKCFEWDRFFPTSAEELKDEVF
jgi:hypothetical protein